MTKEGGEVNLLLLYCESAGRDDGYVNLSLGHEECEGFKLYKCCAKGEDNACHVVVDNNDDNNNEEEEDEKEVQGRNKTRMNLQNRDSTAAARCWTTTTTTPRR